MAESTGMRTTATVSETGPGLKYFAAAALLILLVHLLLLFAGATPVLSGYLPGQDSYMRLLRVEQLRETWAWFDGSLPRSNWPYGEIQNWTRPVDVLLLVGALALEPLLGFHRALFWWGSALAPLLHVATVLTFAWAVAPFMDRQRQFLVVLALMVQEPIWPHGVFGRADHHMLIFLVLALTLGGAARLMSDPWRRRDALLAGAAAGLGMWLTVEFLVVLAMIFAAFTLRWLRDGGDHAMRYAWHGLGLTAVMAFALLADRPPGAWFAEEYDRIAVAHLLTGVLATAFWAAARFAEQRGVVKDPVRHRAIAAVLGAAVTAGIMLLLYPRFFAGPFVDFSKELWAISTDATLEFQPMLPVDLKQSGRLLLEIGAGVLALPYLVLRIWQTRGENLWRGWLLVLLGLLLFLPLTLLMRRFSAFGAVFLAIVIADLVATLMERKAALKGPVARTSMLVLVVVALFGHTMLGATLERMAGSKPAQARAAPGCPLNVLLTELLRPEGLGRRPHTVLWHPNHAPMILYHTPHNVISTLYARNTSGQLDAFRIYTATDWQTPLELVRKRGIEIVVTCKGQGIYRSGSESPDTFESRLRRGETPDWLRPLELGDEARAVFDIYRVTDPTE
jgi:hypothetical protein